MTELLLTDRGRVNLAAECDVMGICVRNGADDSSAENVSGGGE
jgi:hypothetical protein